jgi:ABC-type polysaccharide/polyol phosphate export permease
MVSTVVYLVGSLVLCIAGLLAGKVHIGSSMLALPLLVILQLMFTTGLSMFLSAVIVFARDTSYLYTIFTQAWFFMSPNFWDMTLIRGVADQHNIPWLTDLIMLNPAFPFLMAQRQIFGIDTNLPASRVEEYFPTSLGENLAMGAAWAVFSLLLGYGFFMSRKRKFADLV